MVLGILRVEETTKVKNNPYYGDYEAKSVYTRTLVNQKYVGLVSPKNGIHITIKGTDGDGDIDIYLNKYYFEGIPENEVATMKDGTVDGTVLFSAKFTYGGHVYDVCINFNGEFFSVDEWLSIGDFEDGNEPDNTWYNRSKGIKWEPIEQ